MGIQPSETLYIGDSFKDRDAALAAGFHFIGVGTGLISAAEFEANQVIGIEKFSKLSTFFSS